jgi:hypothetical protein
MNPSFLQNSSKAVAFLFLEFKSFQGKKCQGWDDTKLSIAIHNFLQRASCVPCASGKRGKTDPSANKKKEGYGNSKRANTGRNDQTPRF